MEAWWPVDWQDGGTAGGKGGAATWPSLSLCLLL